MGNFERPNTRAMMIRTRMESLDDHGKPMRFIYRDNNGKLKINPEAVDALKRIKGPIGVVSVCGRARQEKSFILNQLLVKSNGFQVATHQPGTKKLWILSAPLKRTALDGTEYSLLLIDTERIDAYDQTDTYSTEIFSFAVLLSSMFIYNQIHTRDTRGKGTDSEFGHFSPIFVWLLRLFHLSLSGLLLDLAVDNAKITPSDCLEKALRPVPCRGKYEAAKNQLEKFWPEFRYSFNALKNIEELECRRAYDVSTKVYLSAFDHSKPTEEVFIREAHDEAVQKSVVAFNESAVGAGLTRQKCEGLLHNFFTKASEVIS
ncbi:hypothetical protein CRYUN_Cryun04dG0113700 [Craigia yunnanensis]